MSQIKIRNLDLDPILCEAKNTKLLAILLQYTDIMHACGGKGRCTTCRVSIKSGALAPENLTAPEQRFYDLNKLRKNERLSCQVHCDGDIDLEIPEACKLPHLTYVY